MTPRAYLLLGLLLALLVAWIFEGMPWAIPMAGFLFFCGISFYYLGKTNEEFWAIYQGRDR